MMHNRLLISLTALLTLTSAIPYPQDDPDPIITLPITFPTPTAIITATVLDDPETETDTITDAPAPTHSKNPHWEPIPVFSKSCTCELATARYPCWATDALQRCHFEENFSYGCYMQAVGGCPTPSRICSTLFLPTPKPGPHPCELGPVPPVITDMPVTVSVNVTLPTLKLPVPVPVITFM